MISPEQLRRYPHFAECSEAQLRMIALNSDEVLADVGDVLFEECAAAEALYVLIEGTIDLYYISQEEYHPNSRKEFLVGEINPGEIFGLSALIEPYILSTGARAAQPSRYIQINAITLRNEFQRDPGLGFLMMKRVAAALMERLAYTRIQLAASRP